MVIYDLLRMLIHLITFEIPRDLRTRMSFIFSLPENHFVLSASFGQYESYISIIYHWNQESEIYLYANLLPFCKELQPGLCCSIPKTTNVKRTRVFYVHFSQWKLPISQKNHVTHTLPLFQFSNGFWSENASHCKYITILYTKRLAPPEHVV